MLPNLKKRENFTVVEFYFTQRFLELVNYKTIDTYRVRLNNPRTILTEFTQVLLDWHKGKVKDFATVNSVKEELQSLLETEEELSFISLNKNSYLGLLNSCSKDGYLQTFYATELIIKDNIEYKQSLILAVEFEITDLNKKTLTPTSLTRLNRIIGYFASELINLEYSKNYLYHLFWALFSQQSKFQVQYTFADSFSKITDKILGGEQEHYHLFFKAKFSSTLNKTIKQRIVELSPAIDIAKTLNETSKTTRKFLNELRKEYNEIFCLETMAFDHYSAIKRAKSKISEVMDLLHLGYNQTGFKLYKEVLLIGEHEPEKADTHPIYYQIDGNYDSSNMVYENFVAKLLSIHESDVISVETKEKIKSAIRYFRLAAESYEIEQKFINYWIGIEYIFSNYDASSSTFARFKEFFSTIHSISYNKSIIVEFHNDINRLKVGSKIAGYTEDMSYLEDEKTYDFIISQLISDEPLLAYRAFEIKEHIFNNKNLLVNLNRHRKGLQTHLVRIYRVRNEIIHEAAIKPNIENLTSNIRYYLAYIINSILDFFIDCPIQNNIEGKLTLDDFFTLQQVIYHDIISNPKDLKKIFSVNSVY